MILHGVQKLLHHSVAAKVTIYTVNKDKSNKCTRRELNRVLSFTTDVTEILLLSLQLYDGYGVHLFYIYLANISIQCSAENISVNDIIQV